MYTSTNKHSEPKKFLSFFKGTDLPEIIYGKFLYNYWILLSKNYNNKNRIKIIIFIKNGVLSPITAKWQHQI